MRTSEILDHFPNAQWSRGGGNIWIVHKLSFVSKKDTYEDDELRKQWEEVSKVEVEAKERRRRCFAV